MIKFLKKHINWLFMLFAMLILVFVVLLSGDVGATVQALGSLKLHWVLSCAALLAGYLLARSVTLQFYLHRQGYHLRWRDAFIVTGVGQFYSAVTPSATGGQPMQVYHMRRYGVPVSVATAAVSVKFIGFQLAVLTLGAAAWIRNAALVDAQLGPMKGLIALGYTLNSLLMIGIFLVMINGEWVGKTIGALCRLLKKMHLIRDSEALERRTEETLEEYRRSLMTLRQRPLDALVIFALCVVQVLLYMGIIICVYHAFKLSGVPWTELVSLQVLLFITASFVPLPGAAGAQEGGFYLFFFGIFPEETIVPGMVAWRFFTYYLLLLLGMAAVVFDSVRNMVRSKRRR